MVDDFGADYSTEYHASSFNAIMEHRHGDELATCVASNLSLKALAGLEQFARSVDRWRETCGDDVYELSYDSLRRQK